MFNRTWLLGALGVFASVAACSGTGGGNGGFGGSAGNAGSAGSAGNAGAAGSAGSAGSAGAGGSAGMAGMAGSGGNFDKCPGIELTQDGVLDVDLKAIRVRGAITLNGALLPDEVSNRGALVFRHKEHGITAQIPLGSVGPGSYDIALPPGVYDIELAGNASLCRELSAREMPCNSGTLKNGVSLLMDGVLDVDIPAVTIRGALTQHGAPLPSATQNRGELGFDNGEGTVLTRNFQSSGPGNYELTLLPGSYGVSFAGNGSACNLGAGHPVPCNSGPLKDQVDLRQSGVLDLDLKAVHLQGTVSMNGAPMPAAPAARGAVSFKIAGGDSVETDDFNSSGPAVYGITLLAGIYEVGWAGVSSNCDVSGFNVPCNDGPLKQNVTLTQDGVLDLNVPMVIISGTLRVNGQPMPAAPSERGDVSFRLVGGSAVNTDALGASGPAAYELPLLAGSYDVGWNGRACDEGSARPVPCNDGVIKQGIALTQTGVLDLDLPGVTLQGNVTVNGQAFPAANQDRGQLTFSHKGDDSMADTDNFGAAGNASYGITLLAGSYDVGFSGNASLCHGGTPSALPCNEGVVLAGVKLDASGVLDVNVPSVVVQGAVTLNGAPLPSVPMDRGNLSFLLSGADSLELDNLGSSGPGAYHATLIAGRYVVAHEANSGLCEIGGLVPCADQVLLGCTP